ncbi:hypothetical protein M9Y10_005584 [Tritrichomonas musculus]|uniref:Uncharacterized protein n=1 Tax=Tritrichomonas musculus TaxID=1915356 RepID=A0ABR2JC68_9EUKA
MNSKDNSSDAEEDDEPQSTKYLFSLHQQYDDILKEGEVVRQRLYQIKELAHDIECWTKNIPENPDTQSKKEIKSPEQVNILPISIPIRTYINEEETLQT